MVFGDKINLRVYFFKDDCDMILEFVCCCLIRGVGGDLFGLWINDCEFVFYIVIG